MLKISLDILLHLCYSISNRCSTSSGVLVMNDNFGRSGLVSCYFFALFFISSGVQPYFFKCHDIYLAWLSGSSKNLVTLCINVLQWLSRAAGCMLFASMSIPIRIDYLLMLMFWFVTLSRCFDEHRTIFQIQYPQ